MNHLRCGVVVSAAKPAPDGAAFTIWEQAIQGFYFHLRIGLHPRQKIVNILFDLFLEWFILYSLRYEHLPSVRISNPQFPIMGQAQVGLHRLLEDISDIPQVLQTWTQTKPNHKGIQRWRTKLTERNFGHIWELVFAASWYWSALEAATDWVAPISRWLRFTQNSSYETWRILQFKTPGPATDRESPISGWPRWLPMPSLWTSQGVS